MTTGVWGCDPSTLRVSVAEVTPEGVIRWDTLRLPRKQSPAAWFHACHQELELWLVELLVEWNEPEMFWLEEPFAGTGRTHVHPSSNRMLGVILAAVGRVLGSTPVELIGPTSWKKTAMGVGNGHLTPPEYLAWMRLNAGYTGDSQDEAAAIGVALAGARSGRELG